MIDSVLKGTGNSRFLKSAVPAGTSWADALAMLQAGTFPIDFNGINTEGFQQVGTSLNKANLLKDVNALTLGLPGTAVPDDMFNVLAHAGDLHVWKKTVVTKEPIPEVPGSYTLGSAAITNLARMTSNGYNGYAANILVSKEIKVNLDGSVELVSPTSRQMVVAGSSEQYTIDVNSDDLLGAGNRYFTPSKDSNSNSSRCSLLIPPGTVYYVAPGTTYTTAARSIGSTSAFNAAQLVTGVPGTPAIPAGTTTTYPVSTNPNAYQEGDDAKAAGYTLGEVIKSTGAYGFFGMMGFAYGTSYFQKISDAIEVADDGSVSHVAPVDDISDSTVLDSASVLKERIAGKYITLSENSYTKQPYTNELPPTNTVLYIPADVNVKMIHPEGSSLSNQYALFFDRYQPVTGYAAIPTGTTIEYLGKLGDKARVQVVSYVGTGTYGESNPNSLTFGNLPEAIIFLGRVDSSGIVYSLFYTQQETRVLYPKIIPNGRNDVNGYGFGYSIYGKRDGNTISWYSTKNQDCQANSIGYTFYYLVLS